MFDQEAVRRAERRIAGGVIDHSSEELKKAAAQINKVAKRIQARMIIEDMIFPREEPSYSRLVSTARMAPSSIITDGTLTFRPFTPLFDVITSPYAVETKKLFREEKRGFWRRLWDGLTDLNQWPYSRLEYYEMEVPAIVIDRRNNRIICHPSLERDIKKVVDAEGAVR